MKQRSLAREQAALEWALVRAAPGEHTKTRALALALPLQAC